MTKHKKSLIINDRYPKSVSIGRGLTLYEDKIDLSFKWKIISTNETVKMKPNTGYIGNTDFPLFKLPSRSNIGDIIKITGNGSGEWRITQKEVHQIILNEEVYSTEGVTGSITANDNYNYIEMQCIVANRKWVILNLKGTVSWT